jgi:hypothetical protein
MKTVFFNVVATGDLCSIEPFPALTVQESIRSTVTICKTWVAEGIVALHE